MKFVEWTDDDGVIIKLEADDLEKVKNLDDFVLDEIINLCTEHAHDEEPEE